MNNDKVFLALQKNSSVILASSRIRLIWIAMSIVTIVLTGIFGKLLLNFVRRKEFDQLYIPISIIAIMLVILYLVFCISSIKITKKNFIIINVFGKHQFNHKDLVNASSFSIALWDPLRVAYYTKIHFKKINPIRLFLY